MEIMPGDGSNGELAALVEMMQKINLRQRILATLVQNGMRLAVEYRWDSLPNLASLDRLPLDMVLKSLVFPLRVGAWRIT